MKDSLIDIKKLVAASLTGSDENYADQRFDLQINITADTFNSTVSVSIGNLTDQELCIRAVDPVTGQYYIDEDAKVTYTNKDGLKVSGLDNGVQYVIIPEISKTSGRVATEEEMSQILDSIAAGGAIDSSAEAKDLTQEAAAVAAQVEVVSGLEKEAAAYDASRYYADKNYQYNYASGF